MPRQRQTSLPGYKALGGPARQYVDTRSGEVISRRQYQKLQNKGVTPERMAARNRERVESGKLQVQVDRNTGRPYRLSRSGAKISLDPMRRYRGLVMDFKAAHPRAKVRGSAARTWRDMLDALRSNDNTPGGRKARALIDIGRRRAGDPWLVGETPDDDADETEDYDPDDYFDDYDESDEGEEGVA